jgi:hypothetical protein
MKCTSPRRPARRASALGGLLIVGVLLSAGCEASSDTSASTTPTVASTTPTVASSVTPATSAPSDGSTKSTTASSSVVTAESTADSTTTPQPSATLAPTSDDICRAVTKAEAANLLGRDVNDGKSTSADGPLGTQGGCVYLSATATQPATLVNVGLVGTKITHDQFLAQLAEDAPDAVSQAGVGEDAKLVSPGMLTVYDHGTVLFVEIVIEGRPSSTDTLVAVAKKALDRL